MLDRKGRRLPNSVRKNTYSSVVAYSGAVSKDRKLNNRMMRRIAKYLINSCEDHEALILPIRLDDVMERTKYRDKVKVWNDPVKLLEHYPVHQIYCK